MKILWISHVLPYPPKRGVLLRSYNLIKELSKYHSIDLVALNQRSLIEPYYGDYQKGTHYATNALKEHCNSIVICDSPADKHKFSKLLIALKSLNPISQPYTINWLKSNDFKKSILDLTLNNEYDHIHCDTISLAPYVENISKISKTLGHHNIESEMMLRRSSLTNNVFKKLYYLQEGVRLKKYEKRVCNKFTANITCSELDSSRLKKIDPSVQTYVAANSVDINFFQPSAKKVKRSTLIFIGTLSWYPNVAAVRYVANQLWPKLKKIFPEIVFNVIGANPPEDLLKFSDKEKNFNILGYVDDLNPYLAQATAYLCPIFDGGGTKLKMLDAMAAGKAIIAHETACEGLSMTDGTNVLMCSTPNDFLKNIHTVITNESVRTNLESAARMHAVNRFSSQAIGHDFADYLQNICSNTCAK